MKALASDVWWSRPSSNPEKAVRELLHLPPRSGWYGYTQPEKVGHYLDVSGLRIEPSKVGDAKVFRTWGWTIALIVSEDLKEALERMGATGAKFKEV